MKSCLIVFAKKPEPGKVKTRLTSLLSPQWAARLYEAFLIDALNQYAVLDPDVRLYVVPPMAEMPGDMIPDGVTLHEQSGQDLGARMQHAFVESFMAGYQKAVIIGTDHPTLPDVYIQEAFDQLNEPYTVVIGPSDDGGYYLMGMNEYYRQPFVDMSYSHRRVFKDTLDRIDLTGAQSVILPEWYDVDTPEALRRLVDDLAQIADPPVRTTQIMHELMDSYPEIAGPGHPKK